ncbi:MAG: type VI secretion system tip protein TssI/VgrG [Polyangiaceae bacterium]
MSGLVSPSLDVIVSVDDLSFTRVRRYALSDGLHTLPEITVELLCDDPCLDVATLIGQRTSVRLDEPHYPRFDGVLRAIEQLSVDPSGQATYAFTVAPPLWLTTERSDCFIFQGRTVPEIAADIAARYAGRIAPPELRLSRPASDFPRREYCVQYGETDHDFLFRILAEEGLVSRWAPSAAGPADLVWTLTDDTSMGRPAFEVPYRPPTGVLVPRTPHVRSARMTARLATGAAKLRDYDYAKPAFRLEGRATGPDDVPAEEPLVRYRYAVGAFRDDEGAAEAAVVQLQADRARHRVYEWEASFAAPAGTIVRLDDHPREDANGAFLIVRVRSEVDPFRRVHFLETVPAAAKWRPAKRPKPRIHGTQTAFVTGAPGKEIDVDKEGRILVRFHWDDRPNGASRRVRVAMPWMGSDRGFWTVPRAGDEVVIAFLDGDPDQPLLVGSVNNGVAPPAAILPQYETQCWWKSRQMGGGDGYNAVMMEDRRDQEILGLHAHRDYILEVGRDSTTNITGAANVTVQKGQTVNVGGAVKTDVVGPCQLRAAELTATTDGDINLNANGARNDSAESFHYTSGRFVYVVGRNEVEIIAQDSIKLKVGSSSITLVDGKITLTSPLIELNP